MCRTEVRVCGDESGRLERRGHEPSLYFTDCGGKRASRLRWRRATAAIDGERMVVTIIIEGRSRPLRRIYYLDAHSLVIEESSGAEATRTRAYYNKS